MKKAKATEEEARARARTDDRATQQSLPSALAAYTHPPAFAATRACLESSTMNVYSHNRSLSHGLDHGLDHRSLSHGFAKSGIYIYIYILVIFLAYTYIYIYIHIYIYIYILEICCHQEDSEFNIHIVCMILVDIYIYIHYSVMQPFFVF